jgi:serine/threonine protein phosphatase PrpC
MAFWTACRSIGQSGEGDDRCLALVHADRVVIAVADGAGGTGRGAEAATFLVHKVSERSRDGTFEAVELLRACDIHLAHGGSGGETTAVVAVVDQNGIIGASVGDSGAWIVDATTYVDLTRGQVRKPLIGSGAAVPVPFTFGPLSGTLLVASDGLFKYGNAARIREITSTSELDTVPERLIDSVRLRSGRLQDDVAVAICRSIRDGHLS